MKTFVSLIKSRGYIQVLCQWFMRVTREAQRNFSYGKIPVLRQNARQRGKAPTIKGFLYMIIDRVRFLIKVGLKICTIIFDSQLGITITSQDFFLCSRLVKEY